MLFAHTRTDRKNGLLVCTLCATKITLIKLPQFGTRSDVIILIIRNFVVFTFVCVLHEIHLRMPDWAHTKIHAWFEKRYGL